MKLLVAGASGFIGKNLILRAPRDWNITGIYFKNTDFLKFLSDNKLKNVSAVQCDLSDEGQVFKAFAKAGKEYDAALFAVGNSDIAFSVKQPKTDLNANLISLINLLSAVKIGRFVFMSSGTVYLGNEGRVSPKTLTCPDVPYGITKLASELYIKYFCQRAKTVGDYAILRFFGAYGPMEPLRKIYTNLIKELYFNNKTEYTLRGDGKNLIDAMYITDTIEGIYRVLTAKDRICSVFDFCKGEPMTVNELVERAAYALGKKVKIIHAGDSSEYIKFHASPEALANRFDFRAKTTLDRGILYFLQYMKNNNFISSRS